MVLWRQICLVNLVLATIFAVSRKHLPETPRYLVVNHRIKETEEVLDMICKANNNNRKEYLMLEEIEIDEDPLDTSQDTSINLYVHHETTNLTKIIWISPYTWTTFILSFIYLFCNFGFSFMNFFMPELLEDIDVSGIYIYLTMFVQQITGTIGVLFSSRLIETSVGRKYTIVIAAILSGIFNVSFITRPPYWLLLILSTLSISMNNIAWSAIYTITPESYRTDVRNTGVGWANSCAKLGGILGVLIGGALQELGFEVSVGMSCLMFIISGMLALFLQETRGKNIDEIS